MELVSNNPSNSPRIVTAGLPSSKDVRTKVASGPGRFSGVLQMRDVNAQARKNDHGQLDAGI